MALPPVGLTPHHELCGPRDASASAIVLLHGLGSSSADWKFQIPAFSERNRVIVADLRGHGRSASPRGFMRIEDMAEDVAALLERLGEPAAHVVGLSLGGCVALALTLAAPARVRSLTLVNAFARLRPSGVPALLRIATRAALITAAPMRVLAAHVARGLFPRPAQRDLYLAAAASLCRTPRSVYAASARALMRFDVAARLGEIACPTLVIAGAIDQTVPLAAKEALTRGIPGARLVVLPDSGHATPVDAPDAFNQAVLDFVAAH